MSRPILTLSMRHLKFHELPDRFGRTMGECLYTMDTSNWRWPDRVTYSEMKRARSETIRMAVSQP